MYYVGILHVTIVIFNSNWAFTDGRLNLLRIIIRKYVDFPNDNSSQSIEC